MLVCQVWCYGVNDGNCCWSISSTLSVVCSATVLYLLLYNNISHILYQHDLLCTVYLYIESDGTLLNVVGETKGEGTKRQN